MLLAVSQIATFFNFQNLICNFQFNLPIKTGMKCHPRSCFKHIVFTVFIIKMLHTLNKLIRKKGRLLSIPLFWGEEGGMHHPMLHN